MCKLVVSEMGSGSNGALSMPIAEAEENRIFFSKTYGRGRNVVFWSTHRPVIGGERIVREHITVKTVDAENVISRGTCFLELDLYTVKSEDLQCIKENFMCCCYGHGRVHAFVIWFSVEFPRDVILSTSPYDSETHWQQTVLYINPVDVKQDSEIRGTVTINPSADHHRQALIFSCLLSQASLMLDVELAFTVDGRQARKQLYRMSECGP
ncbi:hypothetical protein HPB50_019896 [Hyalomma asiaticum]|uniref:Uncharacterized protein n=1 Tax=Hyalomma asiaticum TaxID=266040 RepID=A0ACB7S4Z1_HYAAI|nr:hypothetical protein HPB50_019896 [Hyalomma asiaticum]